MLQLGILNAKISLEFVLLQYCVSVCVSIVLATEHIMFMHISLNLKNKVYFKTKEYLFYIKLHSFSFQKIYIIIY